MSGGCTVRLLLIVAWALATIAHCARPLEDEELSAVILRLLETSRELPANHLAPPHEPSAIYTENSLELNGQPAAAVKEVEVKSKPTYDGKSNEESSKAHPGLGVDDHDQELQRPKWMPNYFNKLHFTPGSNPIGKHGRVPPLASTTHVAGKQHYLPQNHKVKSKTMYEHQSNEEISKANTRVVVDASGDDRDQEVQRPKWMRNYSNMLHLTPSGANPIGNHGQSPNANTIHVTTKYRYPPKDHRVESRTMPDGESIKANPWVGVQANTDEQPLQRANYAYNYSNMLHKTPSGPNPIGNKYGSTRTTPNVKTHRYPPPEHRVKSKSMHDGQSSRESAKASLGVSADSRGDDQQFQRSKSMYRYYSTLHKTPAGPNPIGNAYRPTSTNDDVKRYRYPPQG